MVPDPASTALDELAEAYKRRLAGIATRCDGPPIVGYVGADVPLELLAAAGTRAVRICGDPSVGTGLADAVAERAIDGMARSQLQRLLDGTYAGLDHLLVAHDTEASVRLFHYLREVHHLDGGPFPEPHVVDVLHQPLRTSTGYVVEVVRDLGRKLGDWIEAPLAHDLVWVAIATANERRRLLEGIASLRTAEPPRLSGSQALAVIGAAATMTVEEHLEALRGLTSNAGALPGHDGRRVFVTGSSHDHPLVYDELERSGLVVVGEDHDWGHAWFAGLVDDDVPDLDLALAVRYQGGAPRSGRYPIAARAAYTAARARAAGAEAVIGFHRAGDDATPWEIPSLRSELAPDGIKVVAVRLDGYDREHAAPAAQETAQLLDPAGPRRMAASSEAHDERDESAPARRQKRLRASVDATAYQREWFRSMQDQVAAGSSYALVNADAPHEILRAMGIPYVVNQWWASVCAAKQRGPEYLGLLRQRGYPDDIDPYSTLAFASALAPDPARAPWGGLPRPALVLAETTTDSTARIFELWAQEYGVPFFPLEATVAPLSPRRWFDVVHHDWASVVGPRRLDLAVEELTALVGHLEAMTGRGFDEATFARVMALANEQQEWNARTRDLIARSVPAPIAVTDAIPATMIPQWHRGSEWGRDAAHSLYEEVAARAEAGESDGSEEQVRLMWIGRGLWFDMAFYERFRERYGAVFVWSMYLAVAADAYLRYGDDHLRTLAARFTGFADQYNTPPWSSEWYAKEALHNQIDGVVHLTTDAVRGTHFITRAIEAAGVPVLEIAGSNVDSRAWDPRGVAVAVEDFIGRRASVAADRRRAGAPGRL